MPDDPAGRPASPAPDDPGGSTIGHVRRARDGDAFAWETPVPKLRSMLREAFAHKPFPQPHSVDDLIAITLADVFRGFGGFQFGRDANFRGWVMRIARNNYRDLTRWVGCGKRDERDQLPLDGGSESSPALCDLIADPAGHRPSMVARLNELSAAFQAALAKLREETRRVIELRMFHGLTCEEIAREVGRNKVETVKAIYHRGMQRIQEDLGGFQGSQASRG